MTAPLLLDLPKLVAPNAHDTLAILPELIMSGGFVLLLMLDLVTPPTRRTLLAGFTAATLLAALGAVVWGWFDAGTGSNPVFFDSLSYDRFSRFIDVIVIGAALLVVLISPGYLNRRGLHYGEYYALLLAATVGMTLLAAADSLMTIFLAIELLSIALYILSGFSSREERSQEAALKYLLLGGFASGFLLYGMALIYGETGHVQLAQIKAALEAGQGRVDPLYLVGILLLLVGLLFKVSAAPFHFWTPDVYQGAPTSVTTFMSVATKVAAFAALIRVFDTTLAVNYDKWSAVVIFVCIVSMVYGNVAALTQTSLKRMLAYSGVAQAGYILIGVAVKDPLGTVGALYYLAAYATANIGAFAIITIMAGRGEDLDSYSGLRGLAFRRPYVAASMGFFLLSLGGFPPTAGFFAKFLVFAPAVHSQPALAYWGIATSVVSVFYYLRVALLMYTRPRAGEQPYPWSRTTFPGALAVAITAGGTLALGTVVFLVYNVATMAQQSLPLAG